VVVMIIGLSLIQVGLTSIGMTFLIMTGGSDLSAGSVAAFGGVFIAWGLKNTGLNWVVLVLIVLAASSVAGIINGLMVTRLNIVPLLPPWFPSPCGVAAPTCCVTAVPLPSATRD
jgi:ribose transport system permease protein